MRKVIRKWTWRLSVLAMSGWLFQAGCIRTIQQELEVLLRPEANSTLIRESFLVDFFGPEIIKLFNY